MSNPAAVAIKSTPPVHLVTAANTPTRNPRAVAALLTFPESSSANCATEFEI